jgi:type IV pilus assembly protein PilY1
MTQAAFVKTSLCLAVLAGLSAQSTQAQLLNFSNTPLYVGANVPPMVMLTLSKDQQLFKKAYNDYSDLDGDGLLETTYKHSIDYYGYFDPYKCYTYYSGEKRFQPRSDTSTLAASDKKYCDTVPGQWSGNFLNWATMTRIDAVRKLLYGGRRTLDRNSGDGSGLADGDTTTSTVLERAYLPTDAHAFAKYYDGPDIARLTPVAADNLTATSSDSTAIDDPGTGSKEIDLKYDTVAGFSLGDRVDVRSSSEPGTRFFRGEVTNIDDKKLRIRVRYGGTKTVNWDRPDATQKAGWIIRNAGRAGITVCNATLGMGGSTDTSENNTNLPRMRVAKGNYALWNTNERWQCYWDEEGKDWGGNGNDILKSGLAAAPKNPKLATVGTGTGLGDMFVRVQACVPGLIGFEKCKTYPGGSLKPVGLLQVYADPKLLQFGLVTGSYDKNVSGGVLRKNIGHLDDEVDQDSGVFKPAPTAGSIINTINNLRMYGYQYSDGTYLGGEQCDFQLTSITEGRCTSWGNPMSEIYYESLRYFGGGRPKAGGNPQATSAYLFSGAASRDAKLNLPRATWTDPLNANNYCAPLNSIVFNASVSTNDNEQIPAGSTKSYLGTTPLASVFSTAIGASDAKSWANPVGLGESLGGTSTYFIGRASGGTDEFCTAKTIAGLGEVSGICPEGPTVAGSYLMAGLAYAAHVNRIRDDITVKNTNPRALKVDTYGVQLATNVPQITVPVPGSTQQVVIQPAYRLVHPSRGDGGGALVDMKIVKQEVGADFVRGSVFLSWEDSEQGGDYDQDVWGILDYCLKTKASSPDPCPGQGANTISVTTRTVAESTANAQGFGFILSGTKQDGPHFFSGIRGFNYNDPDKIDVYDIRGTAGSKLSGGGTNQDNVHPSGGCSNCQVGQSPKRGIFALGTSSGQPLKDPLWYAAKWGGFRVEEKLGNAKPDLTDEWDVRSASGAAGADGVPDNYFFVSNPLGLEQALDKAFVAILATSSASSVATNSTSLRSGSRIYQARFNSNDWSGQLLSFSIDLNGVIGSKEEWDAGQKLSMQLPGSRVITTYDPAAEKGVPFQWSSLASSQQSALNLDANGVNDGKGQQRLEWLRGSSANEGLGYNQFRRRPNAKLGDIVSSNPQYVGPPSLGYADASYATFKSTWSKRRPLIYVGANDGMLHAFEADPTRANVGEEAFAYVPSSIYYKLSRLTAQGYAHRYYVDGSPTITDVQINGQWRTILVGAMGAGSQSLYALDVTDPDAFKEANADKLLLWEFGDRDDADLGFTFAQPKVAKMANGKWAVIVGNGYNNTYKCTSWPSVNCTGSEPERNDDKDGTGTAQVFILFIEQGVDRKWTTGEYVKLDTRAGTASSPNGLASALPVDVDGDGVADFIYAGDLRGNMWKFDVRAANPSAWRTAFGTTSAPQPLYMAVDEAGTAQPITSAPEFYQHPQGGYMILFGTGIYLRSNDPYGPYQTQSFYGIWDRQNAGFVNAQVNDSIGPVPGSVKVRGTTSSLLAQQSVLGEGSQGGDVFRVTSAVDVDWNAQYGWYIDFPSSKSTGERDAFDPQVRNGRIVFTTLVPSSATCESGGDSWLFVLDALSGKRATEAIFDSSSDGQFTPKDLIPYVVGEPSKQDYASGRKSRVGITPKPTLIAGGAGADYAVTSGSSGGRESIRIRFGGTSTKVTRRAWREVIRTVR